MSPTRPAGRDHRRRREGSTLQVKSGGSRENGRTRSCLSLLALPPIIQGKPGLVPSDRPSCWPGPPVGVRRRWPGWSGQARRGDMEARLANRTRRVGPPAWLAVMLLAQGAAARAQAPGLPGVAPARSRPASEPFAPGRGIGRGWRGARRRCRVARGDDLADDRPKALVRNRLGHCPGRDGDIRDRRPFDLRPARSGLLAAAAVLDLLQRRLERALGALAPGFGRRAPAGLDSMPSRAISTGAVVLHVLPGVRRYPPRSNAYLAPLCAHDAAEPSPDADHERPLRVAQQHRAG